MTAPGLIAKAVRLARPTIFAPHMAAPPHRHRHRHSGCRQRNAHAFRAREGSAPRGRAPASRARHPRLPAAASRRNCSSSSAIRPRKSARSPDRLARKPSCSSRSAAPGTPLQVARRAIRSHAKAGHRSARRRAAAAHRNSRRRSSIRIAAEKPPPPFSPPNSTIPPTTAASCATPKAACWPSSRKTALTPEQRAIREVNSSIYCFTLAKLWPSLNALRPENAHRELYLTDAIALLRERNERVLAEIAPDPREILGCNTRVHLADVDRIFRARKAAELMDSGVTIYLARNRGDRSGGHRRSGHDDRAGRAAARQDAHRRALSNPHRKRPATMPASTTTPSSGRTRFSIRAASAQQAQIGPFARLRPGTDIRAGAHVGSFVEMKNTVLREGAKAPHLSYLGDASIGRDTNIGAGTITCNYDGVAKHPTTIGRGVFIGSDTALVAPVRIGDGAYVAAGSVITDNVPADALAHRPRSPVEQTRLGRPSPQRDQAHSRVEDFGARPQTTSPPGTQLAPTRKVPPPLRCGPVEIRVFAASQFVTHSRIEPTPRVPPNRPAPSGLCRTALAKSPRRLKQCAKMRSGRRIRAMKFGVVQFPGSNCDDDAYHAIDAVIGQPVEFIWHQSEQVSGFDAIILPGGFAFGDYLRTGAIARFSPVMRAVGRFARSGGLVLGICNGFQILLEAGLLPGAMMRNKRLRFLCRQVHVRVESTDTPFTSARGAGADAENAHRAHGRQLFLRPADARRSRAQPADYFSLRRTRRRARLVPMIRTRIRMASLEAIAGICNRERNVLGLMPHPERAVESPLGSADGLVIFRSMVESLKPHAAVPV